MVKFVVKVCTFMLVLAMIIGWLGENIGSPLDQMFSKIFSSDEVKDKDDITYNDIKKADADQLNVYANVKLSQLNQQYITYNSTNISLSQELTSINNFINLCENNISQQTSYINTSNINQNTLISWASDNSDNISKLENRYNSLNEQIEKMDSDISSLKREILSLKDAINSNEYKQQLLEWENSSKSSDNNYSSINIDVVNAEKKKYDAILLDLKERIKELNSKVQTLNRELNSNTTALKTLKTTINECVRQLNSLNAKLKKLIQQSGSPKDTSYYFIIDSEDVLKSKGVVSSGGLFGGLTVSPNPDQNLFGILTDKNKTIVLGNTDGNYDVISNMPPDSYEFRTVNNVKVIVINDITAFWSKTKYLVIVKK